MNLDVFFEMVEVVTGLTEEDILREVLDETGEVRGKNLIKVIEHTNGVCDGSEKRS